MQAKVAEIAHKFGLQGAKDDVTRAMAMALEVPQPSSLLRTSPLSSPRLPPLFVLTLASSSPHALLVLSHTPSVTLRPFFHLTLAAFATTVPHPNQERMASLIEGLYAAAKQRTDAARTAFGPAGVINTTNPQLAWHLPQQHAHVPMLALPRSTTTASDAAGTATGVVGAKGGSGSASMEERRMASLVSTPAAGRFIGEASGSATCRPATRVAATSADVIYLLDQEPHSARSRVVQWWRCNAAPMPPPMRPSARLFAPAADTPTDTPGEVGGRGGSKA